MTHFYEAETDYTDEYLDEFDAVYEEDNADATDWARPRWTRRRFIMLMIALLVIAMLVVYVLLPAIQFALYTPPTRPLLPPVNL